MVEQKFYILLIILVSIGTFIYFRNKYEDSSNIDLILFILGLFSVVTGIVFIYLIHGYRILIECIFLRTAFISGKLIIMGYIFLLISAFFFFERLFHKFVITKRDNG